MVVDVGADRPRRHPMALEPFIRSRLEDTPDPIDRRNFLLRYETYLQKYPAMAYRPATTAERFHRSPKRFRFMLGGNRAGKSFSAMMECLWYATGTHPYRKNIKTPNVGWSCTQSWEMVGTVLWATLRPMLEGFTWRVPSWVNKGRDIPYSVQIRVPGGWSTILFKSYEQGRESFQGTDRQWIHNDEQFPADVFEEQISRIGPGAPLQFWTAMTPVDPQAWLEERLTVEQPEEWDIFEMPIDENRISAGGVIPDGIIDETIESWPEEMRATRRKGKWSSFLGAVFKSFTRDTHVLSEAQEKKRFKWLGDKLHPSYLSTGGIDFGGNNPFVYLLIVYLGDDEWYVLDEYYWDYRKNGMRLMREHGVAIKALNQKWGIEPRNIWADHDKQDRFELANEGVHTEPADKGMRKSTLQETGVRAASGKRQLIETIQTLLMVSKRTKRARLQVAARCRNTIRQMISNRWPKGTDTKDPADLPVKIDDHAVDALEYGIHSERSVLAENIPAIHVDADQNLRNYTAGIMEDLGFD